MKESKGILNEYKDLTDIRKVLEYDGWKLGNDEVKDFYYKTIKGFTPCEDNEDHEGKQIEITIFDPAFLLNGNTVNSIIYIECEGSIVGHKVKYTISPREATLEAINECICHLRQLWNITPSHLI